MDLFFGDRNIDCITAVADVASSLNSTYFEFNTIDFDAVEVPYYVWLNIGAAGVDPTGTGTGIEVAAAADSSATVIAAAIVAAINVQLTATGPAHATQNGAAFGITQHSMGAVTAAVDVDTTFTFLSVAVGSKEFLGATSDIEIAPEQSLVDIKASQTGDILLGQLISSVAVTVSTGLLELTAARWNSIVGNVIGDNLVIGSETVTGYGANSVSKNLLTLGKELLLKPVNSGVDNSECLTFFKSAPVMTNLTKSGTELSTMEIDFSCFLNSRVNTKINLWMFGNPFVNVE